MNLDLDHLLCRLSFLGKFGLEGSKNGAKLLLALPSLRNLRWLLPVSKRQVLQSSLSIYQPSSLKGNIAKSAISLLGRLTGPKLLPSKRMTFWKKDDLIAGILGDSRLEYAVFTGTPGIHRKATVQVMDADGRIRNYIKVGLTKASEDLIENEQRALQKFERGNICEGQVPKSIFFGNGAGSLILMVNTCKTEVSRSYRTLREGHVEFLTQLFLSTAAELVFSDSAFSRRIDAQIESLRKSIPDHWSCRFHRAWSRVLSVLGARTVPMGFCHRDFNFWNTYWERDRLFVFDWEYAEPQYPPLIDFFHFLVKDSIFVRHDKPYQILNRLKAEEKWIKRYVRETRVRPEFIDELLLCYLIDVLILNVSKKNEQSGTLDRWPLTVWAGMIDLLMDGK